MNAEKFSYIFVHEIKWYDFGSEKILKCAAVNFRNNCDAFKSLWFLCVEIFWCLHRLSELAVASRGKLLNIGACGMAT